MRIAARISFGALCKCLGVKTIPGVVAVRGSAEPEHVILTLRNVVVDDDDAKAVLIEKDIWEDEAGPADDPDALRDLIDALLAGDVALARIAGDRLFGSEGMRLACEAALAAPTVRRAA